MKMFKAVLEIEGTFGSKFQEKVAMESFEAFFKSWALFYDNAHKKNAIQWKFYRPTYWESKQ